MPESTRSRWNGGWRLGTAGLVLLGCGLVWVACSNSGSGVVTEPPRGQSGPTATPIGPAVTPLTATPVPIGPGNPLTPGLPPGTVTPGVVLTTTPIGVLSPTPLPTAVPTSPPTVVPTSPPVTTTP